MVNVSLPVQVTYSAILLHYNVALIALLIISKINLLGCAYCAAQKTILVMNPPKNVLFIVQLASMEILQLINVYNNAWLTTLETQSL